MVSAGTLHNITDVNQTLKTDNKTITNTNSFTETNAEGVALKIGTETKVSVGIPLLAEGNVTLKMEVDASYTHTTGNTYTKSTSETFPSQDVVAAHGTTELNVAIFDQEYSGTYDGKIDVTGTKVMGHAGGDFESSKSLYDLIKGAEVDVPSYVKLDDTNQKIYLVVPMCFSGVAGYHTKGKVTFTPDVPNKPVVKMSLEDYKDPVKRTQLLK